ncbi:MAG TPA: hypothetical protein VHT71_21940 [Methylomirabilota bacterium]|nr:hypothetical protein [Methylomirabilota bacterium]
MSDRADADVIRDEHGRRVREHDRHGTLVSALTWAADGRLAEAGVRLADGGWLGIAPGAAHDPRWGASDLLRLGNAPLTHCQAIDWACIDAIPTLAEPARLPAGGGGAVLNLIAALAADQHRPSLSYRGPYPTEQLFLTLLESFTWENAGDNPVDPLAVFMTGGLGWAPAPHARAFEPGGVYVQRRMSVEKVSWRGRSYHRATTQGIERHSAHRLHDAGGGIRASLWAMGAPLEEHLRLTRDGDVLAASLPAPDGGTVQPLGADIAAGLVAIVVAGSAPPLAESLEVVAGGLAFEWGPLAGDLAIVTGERARLSTRLRRALGQRLAGAERAEQVRLGFAALADLAHALGDALRARAQARLAAAPLEAQAAALARPRSPTAAAGAAQTIGRAVERLLEEAGQLLA